MISIRLFAVNLYYVFCCVMAVWMTIKQLQIYFENEDSTSAKQKKFHQSTENTYPDFSFCVMGNGSNQYNESKLPNNILSLDLASMLNGGKINQQNESQKHAAIQQLFRDLSTNNSVSFSDLLNMDAKNVIRNYWMVYTLPLRDGNNRHHFSERNTNFNKTFESNVYRCWTRKFNYIPGQLIKEEGITISKAALENFPRLTMSFHQKNQLLRTTMTVKIGDTLHVTPKTQKLPIFVITLQNIKLIHRRHDANEKCDLNLHNDDRKFLQEVSIWLGCVPIFWKEFSLSWINDMKLTFCTKSEDYGKYITGFLNWDSRYLRYKQYDPPCTEVSVLYDLSTIEFDNDPSRNSQNITGDLLLRISYRAEDYDEISNLRKFNTESMISQIGGFIGIALGVSLIDIPGILQGVVSTAKAIYRKRPRMYDPEAEMNIL